MHSKPYPPYPPLRTNSVPSVYVIVMLLSDWSWSFGTLSVLVDLRLSGGGGE